MTTQNNQTAPTEGVCLMCGETRPLLPGGPLADHAACPGSGHTSAHGDGRDDVRRHAIRRFTTVQAQLHDIRTSLRADLGTGWRLRYLLDHRFRVAVTLEQVADLWRGLAIHGDWLRTFRVAVKDTVDRGTRSTDTLDNGLEELRRAGCRTWLRDAQWELYAVFGASVEHTSKTLSDLLTAL